MLIDPKLIATAAVALLMLAASAAGGFVVGEWRGQAATADKVELARAEATAATKDKERAELALHDLQLKVADANKALAVAEAQTKAAEQMQEQAKQHADDLAQFSKSRLDKLAAAVASATGCGEVLGKYWELKQ